MAIAPSNSGASFCREKNSRWSIGTTDNANRASLLRREVQIHPTQQRQEDADLGGRAQQHELRIRQHDRKVGHRADTEKNERGKDTGLDTEVNISQHAPFVIDAKRHTCHRRNVANNDPHANRDEQQRLIMFHDRQHDKCNADADHNCVAKRQVRVSCRPEKLLKDLHQFACVLVVAVWAVVDFNDRKGAIFWASLRVHFAVM